MVVPSDRPDEMVFLAHQKVEDPEVRQCFQDEGGPANHNHCNDQAHHLVPYDPADPNGSVEDHLECHRATDVHQSFLSVP